jgi:zinc transport system substrate-binding protein
MKIRIGFVSLFFLPAALLAPRQFAIGAQKLNVVATLFPVYDFARIIAQDKVDCVLLLAPGMEAHSFEPRPRDIARIHHADVFIYTGKYMEPWVADILRGVSNKSLLVIDASAGIQMIRASDGKGLDPHVWLDFSNAGIMVENILAGFSAKDPGNGAFYRANAGRYQAELAALDEKFRQSLTSCASGVFITTGHAAFGYLARRYGLKQISPYRGSSPNTEPTPRMMAELIRVTKETGARAVYYEELLSPRLAQTIAAETGAEVLPLSAAHNIAKDDLARGVSFLSIMNLDLRNLQEGLGCRQKQ